MHFVVRRAGRDKVLGKVSGLGRGEAKARGLGKDKDEDKADRRSTVFNPASLLMTTSRRVLAAASTHSQNRSCQDKIVYARHLNFIYRRKLNIFLIPTTRTDFITQFCLATAKRLRVRLMCHRI